MWYGIALAVVTALAGGAAWLVRQYIAATARLETEKEKAAAAKETIERTQNDNAIAKEIDHEVDNLPAGDAADRLRARWRRPKQ